MTEQLHDGSVSTAGVVNFADMDDNRSPQRDLSMHSVVDLFAGPGGIDVAATWLGMSAEGVEWDDDAVATRINAGLKTKHRDVRELGPKNFPKATILAGGPPCQTFTVAGSGSGRNALADVLQLVNRMARFDDVSASLKSLDDERTGLVLEPLRWVIEALNAGRPYEAIVLEQVQTVLPVWEAMKPVLESFGYKVVCVVLRTEEFGVPQTRRRAVLLANRTVTPIHPVPTHQSYRAGAVRGTGASHLLPWETMGSALPKKRGWFEVVSNYGSGGIPSARGRRTSEQPSATVTGKISRNRIVDHMGVEQVRFSPTEAGRLQTFPLNYPWAEPGWAQQVGNAMPPRLAVHALAAAFGRVPVSSQLDTKVDGTWKRSRSTDTPVETEIPDLIVEGALDLNAVAV
ncbi:DNA cytosine methyltransferase [Rhodococcus sp. IEGM 1379]|uniref:DNA cytosine methyltransferase n=1 Tax=Rhodococcus sp. IEGM 1379 TaxID=3047086 RepID=UPI0024B86E76|nr:DNA cytosine methyltransferase [Rhodococcus sp. IEGM 1379]MDI9918461.1 DNA cytosine methyltransferase [Rhodococcus sp. IEGM 1379]